MRDEDVEIQRQEHARQKAGTGAAETIARLGQTQIRYRVQRVNGHLGITHLTLEPVPGTPLRALTAADLAAIDLAELADADVAWWRLALAQQTVLSPPPARWTEETLEYVRDLHRALATGNTSLRQYLLLAGVKAPTADRVIARARAKYPNEFGPRKRGPRVPERTTT